MELFLAWTIITLLVVFLGIPLLGGLFNSGLGHGTGYWEDLRTGLIVAFVIAAVLGIAFSVVWAFGVVTGGR